MPSLLIPIHPDRGPIFEVHVVSSSKVETLTALLDTGAERSSIDVNQARMLGLEKIGEADVVTPSTGKEAKKTNVYKSDLVITAGRFECEIPGVELLEAEIENQGFTLLLGRDILSRLHLIWDGPAKSLHLFV
jgi:hypothetical protein